MDAIIDVVNKVLGECQRPIQQHPPYITNDAWDLVKDTLNSGWVSSAGNYVVEFESIIAKFLGCSDAIATVNGTSALHAALISLGVKSEDEVLCPSMSFVATANAIFYCHATPNFVEIESESLAVCPEKLKKYLRNICTYLKGKGCINKRTKKPIRGLIVTHILGHIGKLEELLSICREYELFLVEDAAQALGSTYMGNHIGHYGDIAVLSFNGNKIITTGGGGMALTNNSLLGKRLRHITTTARQSHKWKVFHDEVGYNYRMPNLNAALGVSQAKKLNDFIKSKRALALAYEIAMKDNHNFCFMKEPDGVMSNYWLCAIKAKSSKNNTDALLEEFHEKGIQARALWYPLDKLPMYKNCPRMNISVSHEVAKRIICLPSGVELGQRYAQV